MPRIERPVQRTATVTLPDDLRAEVTARRNELEEMFGAPAVERLLDGKRLPFAAAIMLAARKPSKEAQAARVRIQEASEIEEVSRARSVASFDDYLRRMQEHGERVRAERASGMRRVNKDVV